MEIKKGFNISINEENKTLHVTDYSTNSIRYSRDMDENGNLTNRHLVDQDDNEILNLPDCNVNDDELD